jgi:hypothetical protein
MLGMPQSSSYFSRCQTSTTVHFLRRDQLTLLPMLLLLSEAHRSRRRQVVRNSRPRSESRRGRSVHRYILSISLVNSSSDGLLCLQLPAVGHRLNADVLKTLQNRNYYVRDNRMRTLRLDMMWDAYLAQLPCHV